MQQSSSGTDEAPTATEPPGLLDGIKGLWDDVRQLAHDHIQLAVMETRLAGQSLVSMVAAGVMIAFLLVSAWLGLLGVLVTLLVLLGVWVSVALLLTVGLDLLLAYLLFGHIKRKSHNLGWKATLASLKPKKPQEKD